MKPLKLSAFTLRLILNGWSPFWGSGIRVEKITSDYSYARVSLAFRWYNKNYMRVQYGGSLYSMTDPFYSLMLMHRLGENYIVWDKAASINYIRPGKSRVYAEFRLTDEHVKKIRQEAKEHGKTLPVFKVIVYDEEKQVVAEITKTLYVRRRVKDED